MSKFLFGYKPLGQLYLLCLLFAVGCGCAEKNIGEVSEAKPVKQTEITPPETPLSSVEEEIERLNAIGYISGTELAKSESNVTIHDKGNVFSGLNLYPTGAGPEAVLMDMEGKILHTWRAALEDIWPDLQNEYRKDPQFWRRCLLYPNGDLVAIFEGSGIIKVDKDSNVLWANNTSAHHDAELLPGGDVLTMTRTAHLVPEVHSTRPILEDYGIIIDASGAITKQVSLLESMRNSEYYHLYEEYEPKSLDVLHTNSIQMLDRSAEKKNPAFKPGFWLVSFRNIDTVAVVNPEESKVVWAQQGPFHKQHDPRILANGNLLVFNNGKPETGSSVMELDVANGSVVWEYKGTPDAPFYSNTCGSSTRLENGNTLICESNSGRAFEVTPGKQIVWEFLNPYRRGDGNEFVADLFDMKRYKHDIIKGWQ